jgi:UDP-N-acetylglucosamine 4,6-dehydratase/5-epimerase
MTDPISGKSILVTGGTGSFGKKLIETLIAEHDPRRVIVFSRDELKQHEMSLDARFQPSADRLRYFLGDVRDKDRLRQAFREVDIVVHAAALKQVPACEYNPFEAVKTNVLGAQNIIDVAIESNVERVVALSTDKACNPINLYGATKLCSDKLFVAGNVYAGQASTRFSVVRYGNVVGSRGSVVPFFLGRRETGVLPITHMDMTRFWITLEKGVRFVLDSLKMMRGGELFVPKIPSMRIVDLAQAIGPDCELDVIGIRPGEKLHEVLISEDDARHTVELPDRYVINPEFLEKTDWPDAVAVPDDFRYSSEANESWLAREELMEMIGTPNDAAPRISGRVARPAGGQQAIG